MSRFRMWPLAPMLAACASDPELEEKKRVAEVLMESGFRQSREGKYEAAAKSYARALTLLPEDLFATLGYADALVDWADKNQEAALALHQAEIKNSSQGVQPSLTNVNKLLKQATDNVNRAKTYYAVVLLKYPKNNTASMRALFGMGKLYYYQIMPPHAPWVFLETEDVKVTDTATGKEAVVHRLKNPEDERKVLEYRQQAIELFEELLEKEGPQLAIESRRWLASLLVARDWPEGVYGKPSDKDQALGHLQKYLDLIVASRTSAEKNPGIPKDQRDRYMELITREIRTTEDQIRMLKEPETNGKRTR